MPGTRMTTVSTPEWLPGEVRPADGRIHVLMVRLEVGAVKEAD